MVSRSEQRRSLLNLWPLLLAVGGAHLVLSFVLYIWQAPYGEAGLPGNPVANIILSIPLFPMTVLTMLDFQLPDRFRIPEFMYPLTWLLSAVMWGSIVATCLHFYRARKQLPP